MKRAALFAMWLLVGAVAWSQSDAQFQTWMKNVGASCGSLKKNLDGKNGDAAAADARKLHAMFTDVHGFFKKKNSEDAMKFAMGASDGFDKVAMEASTGKFDDAS
jgi:hypothetical protein